MTRLITFILFVFILISQANARYCNNPYCAMCNRIFGPMSGYEHLAIQSTKTTPVTLESTPQEVIDAMLEIVHPKPSDTLCDLGCGDGRILVTASKKYGCGVVGIEIDHQTAELAKKNIAKLDRAIIVEGNIKKFNYNYMTIITMYLFPKDMPKDIKSAVKPGTKVISINHKIPGVDAEEKIVDIKGKKYTFYLWIAPPDIWSTIPNIWSIIDKKD